MYTGEPFVVCVQYDQYKTPMENIGLQDSLLSRFDLLFIVLDKVYTCFIAMCLNLVLSNLLYLSQCVQTYFIVSSSLLYPNVSKLSVI